MLQTLYHRIFASIAPAQIPSKSEPSPDDDLEIEDVNFQKFEFLDHDLAKLEAQIETATKQLAKEQSSFTHQTKETESEQPRPTKKVKIVKPSTSWDEEPLIEEKGTILPPTPKVSKKIRPNKLTRPTTAATPLEDKKETILPPVPKVPTKIRPIKLTRPTTAAILSEDKKESISPLIPKVTQEIRPTPAAIPLDNEKEAMLPPPEVPKQTTAAVLGTMRLPF
ncbi:hypothetical protein PSTT_01537 [Puccinia striiformis]|uniref:Uncharacterized protein n=1 Tax=Puccinia striiformis TaxID=27350 RepID=A0A2S4W389_9BASI|nr:hypothetical protein PSTT_01537 [Puccinia striiformis]